MTPRLRTGNMLPKEGKATAPVRISSPFPRSELDASLFAGAISSSPMRSERNTERSVRIGEELIAPAKREASSSERGKGEEIRTGAVALPSFGSMLPVRSLGVIYTLRSGGLVRFELTRDVKGKGWFLPHGTVLVGALRGSEYDRAFISLIGFIDSESGRFVKITGDVLGSDGGTGLRG